MSYGEGCAKCNCRKFFSSDPGLRYDYEKTGMTGWLAKPGNKCTCGHKANQHTVYKAAPLNSGAIATYASENGVRFAATWAKESDELAETELFIYCVSELHVSDPAIRISGRNTYLAIAKAADGRLGWASHYVRGTAEREAAKNCGDRKRPWVYSIHARDGDEHNHVAGEPYCKK